MKKKSCVCSNEWIEKKDPAEWTGRWSYFHWYSLRVDLAIDLIITII